MIYITLNDELSSELGYFGMMSTNPYFDCIDNVVYSKDGKYCYGGPGYGLSLRQVVEVSEGVEKLVSGAFRDLGTYDDNDAYTPWTDKSKMILSRVILPSTLTQIGYACFQYLGRNVRGIDVVCKAVTPPTVLWGLFASGVGYIYVPDESVTAYKAASGWKGKKSKIKPMSELPSLSS